MTSKPPSLPVISAPESTPVRKPTPLEQSSVHLPVSRVPPQQNVLPQPIPRRRWGGLVTFFVLAGITAAGWYYQGRWVPTVTSWLWASVPPPKPRPPVPVVTAKVAKRDMNLYLNGLGTVTSLKTVTIRSRVDGTITSVDFSEGQMVHEGRLLAQIDARPFSIQRDQALSQVERDSAALEIAKLNLNRLNKLLTTNAVNQQQVDEQSALVKQAEGSVKAGLAMVANADLQLDYCKIMAPITGRIGLRLVDKGNIVRASDPNGLAVITQLEPIALVFTIPQDDIPRVQKRMHEGHSLVVDAYDREFKTKLATGKLIAIDNQVDATTGTLKMKAEFENNDNILFPNQFVNTRLLVDTLKQVAVIPSAAVQRGPTSTFVWIVKSDETVDKQDVVVGPSEGILTSIEKGLALGDVVVTEGIDKLEPPRDGKPGSKVSPRESKGAR